MFLNVVVAVFVCIRVFLCDILCTTSKQKLKETRRYSRYPETGDAGGYESLGRCWDLNLGPLQVQPALLTTEPYLQLFIRKIFDQKNLLAFFLCNPLFPPFSFLLSLMVYIWIVSKVWMFMESRYVWMWVHVCQRMWLL